MARNTYVVRGGQLVEKRFAAPLHPVHGRGPMIIRDGMEPIRSTLDGRLFDSKSAYTRAVKDAGCEIVGNERAWFDEQPTFEPQNVGQDIKRAIEELESR